MTAMEKNSQLDLRNPDQFNENALLKSIDDLRIRYLQWVDKLSNIKHIKLGTLGPKGTTSETAAFSLVASLDQSGVSDVNIMLYDNFDLVTEALLSKEVDIILIPNAYNRISDIYWNPRMCMEVYFPRKTPKYGLYARESVTDRTSEMIMCVMPACTTIIEHLQVAEYISANKKMRLTNSTEEAARFVAEGQADIAITNELCAKKYNLVSLAPEYHVDMLWTVFSLRKER